MAGGNVQEPTTDPPTATATTSREIGWKWESGSAKANDMGPSNVPSATLLTRRRLRPAGGGALRQGLSTRTNNPARSFESDAVSSAGNHPRNWDMRPAARPVEAGDADRLNRKGRAHRRRGVTAKDRGPSQGSG